MIEFVNANLNKNSFKQKFKMRKFDIIEILLNENFAEMII